MLGSFCQASPISRRALLGSAAGLGLAGAASRIASARAQSNAFTWRLLESESPPPARWDHTLSGHGGTKQLLLFGGRDSSGAAFGDTWSYDLVGHQWRQLDVPGPEPRFGHAVAVDEDAGVLVLFGGQSSDTFFNDTWLFDFESEAWTRLDTGDSQLPTPRYGLAGAIDGHGRFVISHGFTFEGRFDDTWSLDLSTNRWREISPGDDGARPLRRCLHEMVWDEENARMILFGGCSSGFGPCPQGDLWSFDPTTSAWTGIATPEGPSARSNPALVYDTRGKRGLLIGGLTDAGYSSEIWSGAMENGVFVWTPVSAAGDGPSPRASHDVTLTRGDMYLFGGAGDAGVTNDLWKLSLD